MKPTALEHRPDRHRAKYHLKKKSYQNTEIFQIEKFPNYLLCMYLYSSSMILAALGEAMAARTRLEANLKVHRELERRKTMEVASVWDAVNSPYSFHRKVLVAIASIETNRTVTAASKSCTKTDAE